MLEFLKSQNPWAYVSFSICFYTFVVISFTLLLTLITFYTVFLVKWIYLVIVESNKFLKNVFDEKENKK